MHTEDTQSLIDAMEEGRLTLLVLMSYIHQLDNMGEELAAANLYALWIKHAISNEKHIALFNYAGLLQNLNRLVEALQAYESAISLQPDFPQAYINLGLLHEKLGDNTAALHSWLRLIQQRDDNQSEGDEFLTMALNHIGRVQENLKNYEQAEDVLKQSLLCNPAQPGVIQHWVHIRQKACMWPVYVELEGVSLEEMKRCTSPLAMLALSDDPSEQLQASRSFVARTYPIKEEWLCGAYQHQRLRIGYVSGDFREHAVGFLLPAMLAGHDKKEFELYAYDFTKVEQTSVRESIKSHFDHFKSIEALSDRAAAELIRADEIDVLIDLHGLSAGARPGIFALHPAPRQGTYLGFIGTTSMPWLEFVITDKVAMPQELTPYFTEIPVHVEGSFLPLISYAAKNVLVNRKQMGIPEGVFAMGAMGNTYKITPEMFETWMRLLKRIPDSVLCLIDDSSAGTANLRAQADLHGVSQDRLVFLPRTPHNNFCAQLSLLDIYLDTYPYNCGSTTNDVIHAGVPLVTLYGQTMVSRMGLSVLSAMGQEENATRSFSEYENKVFEIFENQKSKKQKITVPHGMTILNMGEALKIISNRDFCTSNKKVPMPYVKSGEVVWHSQESDNLKIKVVIATRQDIDGFWKNTAAGQSLKRLHPEFVDIVLIEKNKYGLPTVYNKIINESESGNIIYVFMHDDVFLIDYFWFYRIQESLKQFDIVGVIGNKCRQPRQPSWAFQNDAFEVDHISNYTGVVSHGNNHLSEKIDVYAPPRQQVKLLDGLLLACHRDTIVNNNIYFDEIFNFHFYDLDFCRQAETKGLSCGTWDIALRHESGGNFGSPDWLDAYRIYIEKWGE